VPLLRQAGHEVAGHARSAERARRVEALGAVPVQGDTDDPDTLARLVTGHDAVLDLRVAVPPASRAALPGAWREYVRLRDDAAGTLVDAALRAGVPRVVHDTVTMVYADGGNAVLDEDSPVDAPGPLASNLATERHLARFTSAGGVGVVLRCGQFYGPDDEFSRQVMASARRGVVPVLGAPEAWHSAVHVDDVGHALVHALQVPAGVYDVVDRPVRRAELLRILADAAGVRRVRGLPRWSTVVAGAPVRALARSQRVSSARFEALGWRPTVPDRREGWVRAFAAARGGPGR
jgi:nucleoside-diphosphate-sugar epimerase